MDDVLRERTEKEISMMEKVFHSLSLKDSENKLSSEFFDMSSNYFSDSKFFIEKKDYVRAFEAVVISWAYIDAGLKAGFFEVPASLKEYFTF
ncbi:MAG: DUF357 domain-containing protein [Candidatus Parvarchaeota archaeon]|nr:DUF357 domain-containing protein [Candidatus Parvarchaeota archaeon]MCW1295642.1 DUF357 domain-containing protein [Candidatus Parvarchaeum tengchongense]MCW1298720.1 DUF357 domain-containing protein [Candidatus Parvarchaeum tengchongense]MCW1312385.1 DUF357 domain-containing protein [Candidatus Parvarchaeum tengchongense]